MLGLKAKLEFWDLMLQGSGKMFHQQSVLASGAGAPVENRMAFNEPFTALPGPRLSPSHLGTRQQPPSGQRDTNKEPSTKRSPVQDWCKTAMIVLGPVGEVLDHTFAEGFPFWL